MCNIAGYIGNKDAAPILLEMLRRQQGLDGYFSVGIATVHEGKLYCKKILGCVEDFEKEIDLSELPGNFGIAHTRPSNSYLEHAHPFVSNDGAHALCLNGVIATDNLLEKRNMMADWVADKGYTFKSYHEAEKSSFPKLSSGGYVVSGEVMVNLVEIYMKEGKTLSEAHAKAASEMYSERVSVSISADTPDTISVCRITRPMEIMIADGETYIASTRFGFPEIDGATMMSLPHLMACDVAKGGFKVTKNKITGDPVPEISPLSYKIAYEKMAEMMSGGKEHAFVFDDFEMALSKIEELWNDKKRYTQHARLAYEILWQLHTEGKLRTFVAPQEMRSGVRQSVYMYLD